MTIDKIDRAFYELLRVELVALGYLPDIASFNTAEEYKAARVALAESLPKGHLIDIFGVGAAPKRGVTHVNRFVINRKSITPSPIRTAGVYKYEAYTDNGEVKYRKLQYPDNMSNIVYEIRCIADSTENERLLQSILTKVIGTYGAIKPVDETGTFLDNGLISIQNTGGVDVSAMDNIIEWLFTYNVSDVWVGEFTTLREDIPVLTSIDFGFYNIKTDEEIYKTENFE